MRDCYEVDAALSCPSPTRRMPRFVWLYSASMSGVAFGHCPPMPVLGCALHRRPLLKVVALVKGLSATWVYWLPFKDPPQFFQCVHHEFLCYFENGNSCAVVLCTTEDESYEQLFTEQFDHDVFRHKNSGACVYCLLISSALGLAWAYQ